MAVPSEVTVAFVEYFCLFLSLSACILLKIDSKQPKPYMDEIFHVPQAQKYCDGNFNEWDPMITTLPGLYLFSVGVMKPVSWLFGIPMKIVCSTFWLRSINIIFAIGNIMLFKLLIKKIHGKNKEYEDAKSLLTAIALSLFPLLYFFTFLYYTDCGSTFFVLLMYLYSLHGKHLQAASSGGLAVLFRQTNIVWVVFVAGQIVASKLVDFIQPDKKEIPEETVQSPIFVFISLKQIWNGLKNDVLGVKNLIFSLIKEVWLYAMLVLGFIAFLAINGGIVVGAKDDHQLSLHFPQIFYFLSFTTFMSYSYLLSVPKIAHFFRFIIKRPFLVMLFCVVSYLLIWKFTLAHRYLLADNRHYTFYIWAKIFRRHELVKFALIPCYLYATWSFAYELQHMNGLWKTVYCVCVAVNLIPQMLLEFRYFIVPYIIFRLHIKQPTYYKLCLEVALYLTINGLTFYLYMDKPFKWEDSSDLQRFLW